MEIGLTLLAFLWVTCRSLVSSFPMMSTPQTMEYLQHYGYMASGSSDMFDGLMNFQKMMQMKQTGVMDKATSDAMHKPRCGMPDMKQNKRIKQRGWKKDKLTYRVLNNANPERSHVSPNNMKKAIDDAFKIWAEATDLEFSVGGENDIVDIDISFAKRVHPHGAAQVVFDGPAPAGIELAHAGYPTLEDEDLRGDIHFDDDETWVLNPRPQSFRDTEFNFLYVAVHEIGHALGLSHSNKPAIMGAMYKNTTEVQLESDDIQRIQDLYGSPRKISSRFRGLLPDLCEDPRIDAAFTTVDGSTLVIQGEYYWKLTGTGLEKKGYPLKVDDMWVNAPKNIDAAFTNVAKEITFFVKGSRVWRYFRYRPSSMIELKNFGADLSSVDAIMKGDEKQPTYFFKGDKFFKKYRSSDSSGKIKDVFKGVPNDLDAAVMYKRKDNQPPDPVFFKGDKCYYRRYTPSPAPGKAGQFTSEYVQGETKKLFGCQQ